MQFNKKTAIITIKCLGDIHSSSFKFKMKAKTPRNSFDRVVEDAPLISPSPQP
jgi:hypothetical protein